MANLEDIAGVITDPQIDDAVISQYEKVDLEVIIEEGDFVDYDNHPESRS